jgi:acyl-coenzyme A synthetase/AMP-(fatty) acid ligase
VTHVNFFSAIRESLERDKNRVFLHWADTPLDGQTISIRVAAFRELLLSKRVGAGESVLIARALDADTFLAVLAVMAHGAIPVLPPARASKMKLLKLVRVLHPKWIITNDTIGVFSQYILRSVGVQAIRLKAHKIRSQTILERAEEVPLHQPALVTHSSGSTGSIKTILRSHGVLRAQHHALKKAFPPLQDQVDFPLFPAVILHNLAVGITTVIPDIEGFALINLKVEKIVSQLVGSKVTTMTGNLYYFTRIIEHLQTKKITINSIKAIGVGGSPVPERIYSELKRFFPQASIYCIYGSSEAEPIAIRKVESYYAPDKGYCVGKPASGTEVMIAVKHTLRVTSADRTYRAGEVLVRGEHVVTIHSDKWYRTGDFGYIDELDQVVLTGRQGNQNVIDGVQHYQMEHVLSQLSGVEQVAAIAREKFHLFIVGSIPAQEVQRALEKYFPKTCIGGIHFRKALPMDNRHQSKIIYHKVN